MKCAKKGCLEDAEGGSNYCQTHSPVGTTRPQLRDEKPPKIRDA